MRYEIEGMAGYKRNFVIYDTSDTQALVKACLKQLNLDDKQFQPSSVLATISTAKNGLQDDRQFAQQAGSFHEQKIAEDYIAYKFQSGVEASELIIALDEHLGAL